MQHLAVMVSSRRALPFSLFALVPFPSSVACFPDEFTNITTFQDTMCFRCFEDKLQRYSPIRFLELPQKSIIKDLAYSAARSNSENVCIDVFIWVFDKVNSELGPPCYSLHQVIQEGNTNVKFITELPASNFPGITFISLKPCVRQNLSSMYL